MNAERYEREGRLGGIPYQRHSDESRAAAASMVVDEPGVRALVHSFLLSRADWGATDEEIHEWLLDRRPGTKDSTTRARRVELVATGVVTKSDRTRKHRTGRAAAVWVRAQITPSLFPAARGVV